MLNCIEKEQNKNVIVINTYIDIFLAILTHEESGNNNKLEQLG